MDNLVEGKFGHGGIKSSWDPRDHKVERLGMATEPFDWDKGYDVEEELKMQLLTEDQGQSGSCGSQAARYYTEALNALATGKFARLSAKDSYCYIYYPGGGTTSRDIGQRIGDHGIAQEFYVPSYMNNGLAPSEAFMEDKTASSVLSDTARIGLISAYARSKLDIESLAVAVRDNHGCIILIGGQNNGTWLSQFPQPPVTEQWRHFLYVGKIKMINGKKYIGVKNSWGNNVGINGWQFISEDYPIHESLVFYDKATYTYIPTKPQIVLSWFYQYPWVQGFIDWLSKYKHY